MFSLNFLIISISFLFEQSFHFGRFVDFDEIEMYACLLNALIVSMSKLLVVLCPSILLHFKYLLDVMPMVPQAEVSYLKVQTCVVVYCNYFVI